MKYFFTLFLSTVLYLNVSGQIYGSAAGSYNTYHLHQKKSTPAIQLKGGYNIRKKISTFIGYSYVMPIKITESIDGNKIDETHSFQNITAGANLHLFGRTNSGFSIYFPIAASYVLYNYKTTATGTDSDDILDGNDYTLNFGIALHARIGRPYLFTEAVACIPRGEYNTRDGAVGPENPIPFHKFISFGIRLPFGDEEGGGSGKKSNFNRENIF
jgi:hypothetical protein